jgi:hypothetical protein
MPQLSASEHMGKFKSLQILSPRASRDARGSDANCAIHLTYPLASIDEQRKADWEKELYKKKALKNENPKKQVRGTEKFGTTAV